METKTIKGTTTEHNLMAAFAGESQDFARYTIYAEAARAEGYEQIGRAFDDVARQELAHSRLLLSRLEGGDIRISSSYRADIAGNNINFPCYAKNNSMLSDLPCSRGSLGRIAELDR